MIKKVWTNAWDQKKLEMIQSAAHHNIPSGKLPNPGKQFFLDLAKETVEKINSKTNNDGISYARAAMIRCDLGVNDENQWSVSQLSPELQRIVAKYSSNFQGEKPEHFDDDLWDDLSDDEESLQNHVHEDSGDDYLENVTSNELEDLQGDDDDCYVLE
ncbi:hypothetical protein P9112_005376 [Eukaryota sp. TZLM1-RC]